MKKKGAVKSEIKNFMEATNEGIKHESMFTTKAANTLLQNPELFRKQYIDLMQMLRFSTYNESSL